jgi:hypothetical protein
MQLLAAIKILSNFIVYNYQGVSRSGVHNSNIMSGEKFFFDLSKDQRWYVLTHSKGVFPKKKKQNKQILGFRGPD